MIPSKKETIKSLSINFAGMPLKLFNVLVYDIAPMFCELIKEIFGFICASIWVVLFPVTIPVTFLIIRWMQHRAYQNKK